ncbi:PAS-domain containing protein [Bradyrhizobium sp. ISRA443]|uniref:PAS-domain containing protein n=1 Tax=unclassified Bradyrhizobium TaxID=2631580 RepID=UPI00247A1FF6|nr:MULTISPECIES: PAS-domain containing protein [unclassified Bradyrhizobium]WGR96928.1 PAS-domain containing protein [Bradyrhizobium sp. ISRA436]WGS03815.1 PAS-domain containing protein [Bradyrhizobium sp. ISRA437]WGS10699.1 PAS-domain containing protein [Bradyrhizobium sp. ISRA443]
MSIEDRNPTSGNAEAGSTKGLAFCAGLLVGSLLGSATSSWSVREGLLMAAVVILTVIVVLMLKRHQISDQRLAAERRNLSTAVNNIPQGLILYDASARIIICNRPYLEMFGLSPDIAKPGLHDAAADRAPPGDRIVRWRRRRILQCHHS